MFDLDTINKRNQQAVDKAIRAHQASLVNHNSQALLNAVEAGLDVDLALGRNHEVMEICNRMMDIAFKCAPTAFNAIVKDARRQVQP